VLIRNRIRTSAPVADPSIQLALVKALDALRDGLRPLVLAAMVEKHGPQWHQNPRIQRMVSSPPQLEGEAIYGEEGPALDIALLLKIIGSDAYWYRTFRHRLPGVSRWIIDSLRELRNRISHDDGADPLFRNQKLALQYLDHVKVVLEAIGSEKSEQVMKIITTLQPSRWGQIKKIAKGESKWTIPFWISTTALSAATWLYVGHLTSPRINQESITIGTPDRRIERYIPLKRALESQLKPSGFLQYLAGKKIEVQLVSSNGYPDAVANLRANKWDILLGFSPVVSMIATEQGYKPVAVMNPNSKQYASIFFAKKNSQLRSLEDLKTHQRIALGDYYSASKYYVPLSMLKGRSIKILAGQSTEEIVSLVTQGKVDAGVMGGQRSDFVKQNPGMKILATSPALPQSVVALSPALSEKNRESLEKALFGMPAFIRDEKNANYGPGKYPGYQPLRRLVEEGKAFSACLEESDGSQKVACQGGRRVFVLEGWIDDIETSPSLVSISGHGTDGYPFTLNAEIELLRSVWKFKILKELKGLRVKAITPKSFTESNPQLIQNPNQLDIFK